MDGGEPAAEMRGDLTHAVVVSNPWFEAGMICRADDRGDPVIQISPPLVAGQAKFDRIVGILGDVLAEAAALMR